MEKQNYKLSTSPLLPLVGDGGDGGKRRPFSLSPSISIHPSIHGERER